MAHISVRVFHIHTLPSAVVAMSPDRLSLWDVIAISFAVIERLHTDLSSRHMLRIAKVCVSFILPPSHPTRALCAVNKDSIAHKRLCAQQESEIIFGRAA
jgi:hypothetical protein